MMRTRQLLRTPTLSVLVVMTLLSVSCFEQPITESLEIRFLPGESAMVRVTVSIASLEQFKNNALAQKRIEGVRRDVLEGQDPWTRRLESLQPEAQRTILDRTAGELSRADQRVVIKDVTSLKRFFSDTLVRATVTRRQGEVEFSLVPGPGSRATLRQQEEMRRGMEKWAATVSQYLEAGQKLYTYLEERPGRARACFGSVFQDLLSGETKEAHEELSSEDRPLVEPFKREMEALLSLFDVPADASYSQEELSRLVIDPFPAPLTVRVPGPVLELEGFEQDGPGVLRVSGLSLWEALQRIQDQWIFPNPAVIYYEQARAGKQPFDLEDFLKRRRSVSLPPSPSEVLQALKEPLKPAPIYRVRWSTENLPEFEDSEELWDSPVLR